MKPFGILLDERFKRHVTDGGHPERPERIDAVAEALERAGLRASAERIEPELLSEREILTLHTREYLRRLESACARGLPHIDVPDCPICPESCAIARLAAGGVVQAARRIATGEFKRAFRAVRPPGHHAEADRAMGFCLFNNVALAAGVLRDEFETERTLILDWDVHHGNGTQHLFESDPAVFYISLHGHPDTLYPGTGHANERGTGDGEGFTLNVPLLPGASDDTFRAEFSSQVIPAIERYAPQALIISAGFDAHADDPVGNLELSDEIFSWMTLRMLELAERFTEGRVLSVLEGGYDLEVLGRCVAEHVRLLSAS